MRIDAAVNLSEDPRYRAVPLNDRLGTAVSAQRGFLNSMLDPALQMVLDLRLIRDPGRSQLDAAIVVRALGSSESSARSGVEHIVSTISSSLPPQVLTEVVADEAELTRILDPLGNSAADAAFVTRAEVMAVPVRPDIAQQVSYLYSVVPFHVTAVDWTPLYRRLVACEAPVVVSVALHPMETSHELSATLNQYATVYSMWAQGDRTQGGLHSGTQNLPPETFAVDAAPAFMDYAQRFGQRAYAIRALIASSAPLPAGLAQTFAGAISPIDEREHDHLQGRRAGSSYNLRSGSRSAELARWDLQTADLRIPAGDDTIWRQPHPPPNELADLSILGDAREAGCAFRLPIALTGDLPGFRVRRGRSGHTEAMQGGERPIFLGSVGDDGGRIHIEADSLSKHALIAGGTGSGKTTLVLSLLRQLWPSADSGDRQIPFLVIEPVNDDADDYRKLLSLPQFADDLEVFTVGDERHRPLRFNPFVVPDGVLVSEHMSSLLAAFKAAFALPDPLPAIYSDAIAETYAEAGVLPSETAGEVTDRRWPTVIGFLAAMERVTAALSYKGEVRANLEAMSLIRAKQLTVGPCASAFRTDLGLDVASLLSRPTIVELKTLGSVEEQALMIALLLNAITEHYKANRGAQSEIQHVTVIEEAHRLLGRAKSSDAQGQAREQAAEAFANVLAENRKYGEGIVIAEQIPSKLVEDAVKNTNLKVMCRLTAEEERAYLGLSMALTEEQRLAAARLRIGEALVYADELPNAMEIRSPMFALDDGSSIPFPDAIAVDRVSPFDFCSVCESQCQWRGSGLAISRRPRVNTRATALVNALAARDEEANKLATALVSAVRVEAGRYPWVSSVGALRDVSICALVHSLESRVTKSAWVSSCVKKLDAQLSETKAG